MNGERLGVPDEVIYLLSVSGVGLIGAVRGRFYQRLAERRELMMQRPVEPLPVEGFGAEVEEKEEDEGSADIDYDAHLLGLVTVLAGESCVERFGGALPVSAAIAAALVHVLIRVGEESLFNEFCGAAPEIARHLGFLSVFQLAFEFHCHGA
jgi:hypothetical protein